MKCLRCGKELKNGSMECSCGHFYENNLQRKNMSKKKTKRKTTLVEILAVIIILVILIIIMIPTIFKNDYSKNEQCNIKCEGYSYTIKNNTCICSNKEEYPIEK